MLGNTATGSQSITVKTALVDLGDNHIIMPFAVGTPVKIGAETSHADRTDQLLPDASQHARPVQDHGDLHQDA